MQKLYTGTMTILPPDEILNMLESGEEFVLSEVEQVSKPKKPVRRHTRRKRRHHR